SLSLTSREPQVFRNRAAPLAGIIGPSRRITSLAGVSFPRCQESSLFHEIVVNLFGFLDPLGEFLTLHERLIIRAAFHESLPILRLPHLLEEVDVELHLLRSYAARHENATEHLVDDRQP